MRNEALKAEVAREWPDLRSAFSRPGFVTFKLPENHGLSADFRFPCIFARSQGYSLGKIVGDSDDVRATSTSALIGKLDYHEVHVWQRGDREPTNLPSAAAELARALNLQQANSEETAQTARLIKNGTIDTPTPLVIDCLIVEPNEWWIGCHRASGPETRWPGGIYDRHPPVDMVSRAYLKMDEALSWSQLPVRPDEQVAEIGCSPGGASQALLERGLSVLGIDPAIVDERVLANARFTHIRKRGHEVKRREFRRTRWLTADLNVAPQYTLDTVEEIVTHRDVDVRGMLLTLKLLEWTLAEEIPAYLDRIHHWGYREVRARQLFHNRQEICVVARR